MRQRPAMPAGTTWAIRGRVYLILLAVLALIAAGIFAYTRVTAGAGHHTGDTITHDMPGGGSVAFTLESVKDVTPPQPGQTATSVSYAVRIHIQNRTSSEVNITAVQFQELLDHPLAPPAVPLFYPQPESRQSCDQEVAPGTSMECAMTFIVSAQAGTPRVAWLPDGAGDTSAVWWYLAA